MDSALQALIARIQHAAASKTPLRIRGGGSKDFYGQSLQGELLETRTLSGIVSYEPSELVVTVRAGTPLAELETLLAASGQYLPFEPPHLGAGATVGGMVASGLSGPARSSVGAVRDYVLGVSLVNGRGEHLVFGGQVMKNVAGYDVSRLMAGAFGTLGLLVDVSLKVLPFATAQSTLVFEMSEAKALEQLNRWGAQPLPINASCWHEGALMVRLRGAQAAVAAAQKNMGGLVMGEQSDILWAGLREQSSSFFTLSPGMSLVRLSVPDTTGPLQLGPTLIEWGGAQRWVQLPTETARDCESKIEGLNGHVTLFRSENKSAGTFSPLKPPLERIHRELKQQFDPVGVFNRGRMYPHF